MGDDLDIRSFAAACACARELKQRLFELAAFDGVDVEVRGGVGKIDRVIPVFVFAVLQSVFQGDHGKGFYLCGANVRAASATGTVKGGNLHSVFEALKARRVLRNEGFGSVFKNFRGLKHGADCRMRANERALVALDAVFADPGRDVDCNAAFFKTSGCGGNVAVGFDFGNGKAVAFLCEHRFDKSLVVRIVGDGFDFRAGGCVFPAFGIFNLDKSGDRVVDCRKVHVYDRFAFLAERLDDEFFHMFVGFFIGHYACKIEERRLHRGADTVAETDFGDDVDCVDGIELNVFSCDGALHFGGEHSVHFFGLPDAVQKEGAAVFKVADHIVLRDVGRIVASHEIRRVDKIGRFDGSVAETQVRYRQTARLFAVVREVCLSVFFGVVTDNLDAVFVAADRAVGAESVELATDCVLRGSVDFFNDIQRRMSHVVVDTDREVVFVFAAHVFIDGVDHRRIEFLAAQAITTAENFHAGNALFRKCRDDVEVQRLAKAAAFFRPVHDGDVFAGFGKCRNEFVRAERAVKTNFDKTDFLSFRVKVIDSFFGCFRAAAHDDDDLFGVFCAVVIEQVVFTAGDTLNLFHHFFHDFGNGVVVFVAGFASLEVNIGVLSGAVKLRMLGVQSAFLEIFDILHIDDFLDVFVVDHFDFRNFVRGAEAVEEVKERYACAKGCKVCDESQIHDFLNAATCKHCKARLTARHNVAVVAENVKRVISKRTCAYVENRGQ